ncbi:MAG: DUF885 domain-containing protein [Bacteroidetes bacterium B1(2017)]|nr:MAG: DUF885 domain-containing protein [Bacteroidetes bacterium B1(2017)]
MKKLSVLFVLICFAVVELVAQIPNNKALNDFFEAKFEEQIQLSPFNATNIGDNRFNNQLAIEFTDSYRAKLKQIALQNKAELAKFDRSKLNENDKLSYDIYKYRLDTDIEGYGLKTNRIPFNQFYSVPLTVAQYGSGNVVQPFKTYLDYQNWIERASRLPAWADSAIVYFRKGMAENYVLPKLLTEKAIKQMESFVVEDSSKSVFYGPIKNLPPDFTEAQKAEMTAAYKSLISEKLVPTYAKLAGFLKNEYLPKTGSTSGIGSLPGGKAIYEYNLRQITTTNKTADEIFNTGLAEVKRIRTEMEAIKKSVQFEGSLEAFFEYMRTDPKFYPYKTAEDILNAYRAIEAKITPTLNKLFLYKPKTSFEVRQTEAFRAASAAAQYFAGLQDGSRPGIFYVPIIDPASTPVRESLFIHEAVPGHHYQIMLQRENESLPQFRRYSSFTAYSEGWGLYSESLGKELGLYTDPYQYMKALGDEIHRAIRLVVDPGMHAKGWTREQAIKYMVDNEPITEAAATAEIERYMAIPGQATAYKVGSMKLIQLRAKYTKQLGKKFDLADFHNQILKDGGLPLAVLETKLDTWAKSVK